MNRGALSKKTRAMDMRTLSVRNKIEDGKVIPLYLRTGLMLADIGTKALDKATFVFLRDLVCGYGGVAHKSMGHMGKQSVSNLVNEGVGTATQ